MLLLRGPTVLPTAPGGGSFSTTLTTSQSAALNGAALRTPSLALSVKHMVQNQINPAYPAFSQAGIEEYQQAAAGIQAAGIQAAGIQAAGIQAGLQAGIQAQPSAVAVAQDPTPPQFKSEPPIQTAVTTNGVEQQTNQQTDLESETTTSQSSASATGPKRLHVSNIPFRFREADLRNLLGQFGTILDVEIIFNERGSKGFGFVTFANSVDADRAREKLNGTVVEGRKIEVNNATARVVTKKVTPTVVASPGMSPLADSMYLIAGQQLTMPGAQASLPQAVALRGATLRGRVRAPYPTPAAAAVAAAAAFRHPAAINQAGATALQQYTPGVYQTDPFLQAYAAERYQPYAAGYAAAATRYAIPAVPTAATYATTGGAVLSSYGREYQTAAADPYLGHSIGPVAGYGATLYRGAYQRFAPY